MKWKLPSPIRKVPYATSMSYSAKIWASCLKLFILFSVPPRFLFSLWYRIFNYFNTVTTKLINFLGKKKKGINLLNMPRKHSKSEILCSCELFENLYLSFSWRYIFYIWTMSQVNNQIFQSHHILLALNS